MHPFPHHYAAAAEVSPASDVTLTGDRLPPLTSAPPVEFGGPGDRWSPETLLLAAVVDCFVLNFKAIAAVSRFAWSSLSCDASGTVDRVDGVTRFTAIELRARLRVPQPGKEEQGQRLLAKAEQGCLVTNSLNFTPHLDAVVEVLST